MVANWEHVSPRFLLRLCHQTQGRFLLMYRLRRLCILTAIRALNLPFVTTSPYIECITTWKFTQYNPIPKEVFPFWEDSQDKDTCKSCRRFMMRYFKQSQHIFHHTLRRGWSNMCDTLRWYLFYLLLRNTVVFLLWLIITKFFCIVRKCLIRFLYIDFDKCRDDGSDYDNCDTTVVGYQVYLFTTGEII